MCQKQVQVLTIFQENQLFSQKDATHQTYKGNMRNEKHKKNDTNLCFVDAADSESQDHANGRASRVQSQACLSYAETKPALASASTLRDSSEMVDAVCILTEWKRNESRSRAFFFRVLLLWQDKRNTLLFAKLFSQKSGEATMKVT